MDHFKKDMMYVLGFFILLFIGWIFTGGPKQAVDTGSASDKFQQPLYPLNTGETYDQPLDSINPLKPSKPKTQSDSGSLY